MPSHDLQAEAAVLSACMVEHDGSAYRAIADFLRPEHFYADRHRRIFEAIVALTEERRAVDNVTVSAWLRDRGRIEQIGGAGYVMEVIDAAPALLPRHVLEYGRAVYEHWRRRRAVDVGRMLAAEAPLQADVQPWLEARVEAIHALARADVAAEPRSHVDGLRRVAAGMAGAGSGRRVGLSTGIPGWDALTGGLHGGEKTTIIGPTGSGKSHLVTFVSSHLARSGVPVLVFSLGEMVEDEMTSRRLAVDAGVCSKRVRYLIDGRSLGNAEETARVLEAVNAQAAWPARVYVVDRRATVEEIAAEARRLHRSKGIGCVIVDYIQKITASKHLARAERFAQLDHATRSLKLLAQELGVPVLEMSQQRRAEKDGPRAKPGPEDREHLAAQCPSVIAQEADNMVVLYRYDQDRRDLVTGILLKQRGGEDGDEWTMRIAMAHSRIYMA
jgi:replicative DNA helicase